MKFLLFPYVFSPGIGYKRFTLQPIFKSFTYNYLLELPEDIKILIYKRVYKNNYSIVLNELLANNDNLKHYNNLKEFIALARAKPNSITFGSSGTGSVPHLATEMFRQMANLEMVHAPYKGDAPAIIDLLGGHIDIYCGGPLVLSQHIAGGKLRGIAVTGDKRSNLMPELPAINEAAPGYSATTWFGMWAPLGTAPQVIQRLNQSIGRILKLPEIQEKLKSNAMEGGHNTPDEYNRFIADEIQKYAQVVKNGNIKVE